MFSLDIQWKHGILVNLFSSSDRNVKAQYSLKFIVRTGGRGVAGEGGGDVVVPLLPGDLPG